MTSPYRQQYFLTIDQMFLRKFQYTYLKYLYCLRTHTDYGTYFKRLFGTEFEKSL
jgi:hypothetical protein